MVGTSKFWRLVLIQEVHQLEFIHFEMKKELDFSNIREAFFQTVSNRIYHTA